MEDSVSNIGPLGCADINDLLGEMSMTVVTCVEGVTLKNLKIKVKVNASGILTATQSWPNRADSTFSLSLHIGVGVKPKRRQEKSLRGRLQRREYLRKVRYMWIST